jgi:hypothetical protein
MLEREDLEGILSLDALRKQYEELIIDHGELRFTRDDLRMMGCSRFIGASMLNNRVLKKLNIKTVKELFNTSPLDIARIHRVGEAVIHNVLAILNAHDYNVKEWWASSGVKYSTLHHKAIEASKRRERKRGGE